MQCLHFKRHSQKKIQKDLAIINRRVCLHGSYTLNHKGYQQSKKLINNQNWSCYNFHLPDYWRRWASFHIFGGSECLFCNLHYLCELVVYFILDALCFSYQFVGFGYLNSLLIACVQTVFFQLSLCLDFLSKVIQRERQIKILRMFLRKHTRFGSLAGRLIPTVLMYTL